MSNKTDIWMPLYVADYLSSTTRLTTEQHGAYLLLIIDYWKNGRLPDDDSVLANITRLSGDAWARHRGVLQGFFEVDNGEWIHARIEKEIEKSGDLKLAQTKKSIAGNYVKYGKVDQRVNTDPVLKAWWDVESLRLSPRDTHKDSPKGPPSPSPSHLSKDKNNHVRFAEFWDLYPNSKRKGAKGKCQEVWQKKKFDEHADEILLHLRHMAGSEDWTKDGGQYIKAPLAYLNGRPWDGWKPDQEITRQQTWI